MEENRQCIRDWRSVGLGLFGVADAFVAMKLAYGSRESCDFIQGVLRTMFTEAARTSAALAKEKGAFGKYDWEKTKKSPLIQRLAEEAPEVYAEIEQYGLRNGTLLSIAPTGTISLLMGVFSGGCEPLYQISYERTTHKMEEGSGSFRVYAHSVSDLLDYHKLPHDLTNEDIKKRFPWVIESHDVPYLHRVELQAAMQKYVDNSISSTVNLKHAATPADIKNIYLAAWKSRCKGITVFRDGCKRGNILGVKEAAEQEIAYDTVRPRRRDNIARLEGVTLLRHTSCVDKMYITVNKTSDGDVFELFTNTSGGCQSNIATITRLTSLALRSGVRVKDIIKQLTVSRCSACQALIRSGRKDISLSCGSAIGTALAEIYNECQKDETAKYKDKSDDKAINKECPECKRHTLRPEGNCVTCTYCGWSKCE